MRLFVEAADAVAATTKKLEKVRIVAGLLKSLSLDDAARAAIFLTGRAFPRHEERVLGIGGSNLYRLVAELSAKSADELTAIYRKHGDLGDVAEEALTDRKAGREIPLAEVAHSFEQIAAIRGQAQKYGALKSLLKKSAPGEVKYIVKIITGDLRIGLKESLVEEAIARAFERPADAVRRANMLTGDIGETLRLAAANQLASATVTLFHPIGFMLATPVETADELFDARQTRFLVEEKYDGIRAQIHKRADRVKIFSRTLDEVTEFPELTAPAIALPGEFILDGEILAWQGTQPLPFTELQKRLGRKSTQMNLWPQRDIPVRFVAFDLLYREGALLLDAQLHERRTQLTDLFSAPRCSSAMQLASATLCDSAEAVKEAFRKSLAAGHEGIVAKDPQSPYTPGRRGGNWFKLKEPFATLDVVVTAVEYGHGKRHGVLSDYTFAVRSGEQLLNIGKAYSGLTDAEIAEHTQYFLEHTTEDQGFRRIVEPTVVIEVAFNNMQKSSRHASGYALRFPRIVRFRPDKPVAEIDTLGRVAELYARQTTLPAEGQPKT
jgi:ATP-dependent DNA ligase I